jgi:hypothetical protein
VEEQVVRFVEKLGLSQSLAFWLALILIVAIWLQTVLSWIGRIRKTWIEEIRPIFYNEEQRRRANLRRLFARHVALEIGRLNDQEDWSEQRFADLEAEVETQAPRRFRSGAPSELIRERSLSRALAKTKERLILLEGEPGSGKSTAMRHVVHNLSAKAIRSRSTRSLIPVYVNLKGLHVLAEENVDAGVIRQYVLNVLNRAHNRDVDLFLQEEFDRGLREGAWLFLFDSFDEIPDVLAATSVDDTVRAYEDAIGDFLSGMNVCRGVIASREFRGPHRLSWPRVRVLALSDSRRAQLVRRASLRGTAAREIVGDFGFATPEIVSMSRNPLFLALLCEHVRGGNPFPRTNYSVFETYFAARFERDRGRVTTRYGVSESQLRDVAERIAFQMSAAGLGLSPEREALLDSISEIASREMVTACMDALEFIKIARSEEVDGKRRFTFAHRRFQEYFATRVVMAYPSLVSATDLLTDARWRETAVVLLQTQRWEEVLPIIATAEELLDERWQSIASDFEDLAEYVIRHAESLTVSEEPDEFPWPASVPHLLSTLSAGLAGREARVPGSLVTAASRFVAAAYETGTVIDRKIALEVSALLPQDLLEALIRSALTGKSPWVADVAYLQASHLPALPPAVAREIRLSLVRKFIRRVLWRDRNTITAHVARLNDGQGITRSARLLIAVAALDTVTAVGGIGLLLTWPWNLFDPAAWLTIAFVSVTSFRRSRTFPGLAVFIVTFSKSERLSKWRREFLGFASASTLRVVLTLLLTYKCVSWGMPIALAVAILFLLCWMPLAVLAAAEDRYLAPGWWPVLPVWPLIALASRTPRMVRWVFANPGLVGVFLGMIAFIILTFTAMFIFIPESEPHEPSRWEIIAGMCLAGIVGVLIVVSRTIAAFRRVAARHEDARRLARLRTLSDIEASVFTEDLFALSNADARIEFLAEARKGKRLAATPDAERHLFQLALDVERAQKWGGNLFDIPDLETRWRTWQSPALNDCLYELVVSLRERIERP